MTNDTNKLYITDYSPNDFYFAKEASIIEAIRGGQFPATPYDYGSLVYRCEGNGYKGALDYIDAAYERLYKTTDIVCFKYFNHYRYFSSIQKRMVDFSLLTDRYYNSEDMLITSEANCGIIPMDVYAANLHNCKIRSTIPLRATGGAYNCTFILSEPESYIDTDAMYIVDCLFVMDLNLSDNNVAFLMSNDDSISKYSLLDTRHLAEYICHIMPYHRSANYIFRINGVDQHVVEEAINVWCSHFRASTNYDPTVLIAR